MATEMLCGSPLRFSLTHNSAITLAAACHVIRESVRTSSRSQPRRCFCTNISAAP